MEAGMITTVLLVACATICIGVGIFYFFINNTKNKGRICILLLGIGGRNLGTGFSIVWKLYG